MLESLVKKSLQHRCFPWNIAKFLRTPFLKNASGGSFYIVKEREKNFTEQMSPTKNWSTKHILCLSKIKDDAGSSIVLRNGKIIRKHEPNRLFYAIMLRTKLY